MSVEIIGNAEIIDLKGEVMYSDLKKTGEFSCSDEVVNKLYSNIVWGQRGNFLNVPTDCPQRDERLGWTGDAQIFVGSAMYNMDCKAFYEKYLCDVRDSQFGSGSGRRHSAARAASQRLFCGGRPSQRRAGPT